MFSLNFNEDSDDLTGNYLDNFDGLDSSESKPQFNYFIHITNDTSLQTDEVYWGKKT